MAPPPSGVGPTPYLGVVINFSFLYKIYIKKFPGFARPLIYGRRSFTGVYCVTVGTLSAFCSYFYSSQKLSGASEKSLKKCQNSRTHKQPMVIFWRNMVKCDKSEL